MGTDRGPVHMTGQVSEDRPIPAIPSEMESVEDTIIRLEARSEAFTGSPEIYRQRYSCTPTDGNDLPTNAGGTVMTYNKQTWKRRQSIGSVGTVTEEDSTGLFMQRMDT